MTDRLPAPVRRITDTFKSFTPGQKAVTIFAVLAILVGGYFFATWAAKPSYQILFNNLSTKDASAIVESLQKSGTSYELANDGQTILVPRDQVNALRLNACKSSSTTSGRTCSSPTATWPSWNRSMRDVRSIATPSAY